NLRLPSSTLFPYTTLFRSSNAQARILSEILDEEERALTYKVTGWMLLWADLVAVVFIFQGLRMGSQFWLWWAVLQGLLGLGFLADRKSTRLNSSHVKISYA